MEELQHAIKDDRWHILNRPGMYIGSISMSKKNEYMVKEGSIEEETIEYVPAIIKMINEIIDNSIDILKNKNNGKIEVLMNNTEITVKDNGQGIPIKYIKDLNGNDVLIPYSCWGMAKAGSNFDDSENTKTTIGTNGVGSYCTNVHSSKFTGITRDGKHEYIGIWEDNAGKYEEHVKLKKGKTGTEVTFSPKLETFGIDEINLDHQRVIHQRLLNLSVAYPNIKFLFNNKSVSLTRKQYLKLFNKGKNEGEIWEDSTGKYALGVFPNKSDDFKEFSIINGLNITSGQHTNYLMDYIIDEIKAKLPKKFSDIKPGDIKNKLQFVMIGNEFPEIQWEGQTKESIGNSRKDIRAYLGEEWKEFVSKVAANKTIRDEITFLYQAKLDAAEKKEAANADKELKKVKILKLRKASKSNEMLIITEGDSALKGIIKALKREIYAYYPSKGVGMNVETNKSSKIITNPEYKDIMSALGFTFAGPNSCLKMKYKYVAIAADADVDGSHITGLLLAFFKKYCPDIFEHKRILILRTPIKVAKDKKENMVAAFLTEEEYLNYAYPNGSTKEEVLKRSVSEEEYLKFSSYTPEQKKQILDTQIPDELIECKIPKGVTIEYKKGLGSMNVKEYQQFFTLRPLDECLVSIDYSEEDFKIMHSWVAEDTDFRKDKIQELMLSNNFSLDAI